MRNMKSVIQHHINILMFTPLWYEICDSHIDPWTKAMHEFYLNDQFNSIKPTHI